MKENSYDNGIKKYTKKDGICAFILFSIVIIMYSLLALLRNNLTFVKNNILIFGCITNFLLILITIIFIKINRQK